jgi:hypothetical protein
VACLGNKQSRRQPIKDADSQGKRAVDAGKAFEDTLTGMLRGAGYRVDNQKFYDQTPFGDRMKADLIVYNVAWFPRLVIEAKWQTSTGTVNKSVVHDAARMAQWSDTPCIMVYGGSGHSETALHLARMQISGNLIEILNIETLHYRLMWLAHGGNPIKEPWQRRYAKYAQGAKP